MLTEHRSADNLEVKWTNSKQTVTETVRLKHRNLPYKPWIRLKFIDTMNEREKWKAAHT